MTYTEKVLEEFDNLSDYRFADKQNRAEMRYFIATSIAQTEQALMERVEGIVNFIDDDFLADSSNEEKYPVEYTINFERKRIRTALAKDN